jgi:hypothetical protein
MQNSFSFWVRFRHRKDEPIRLGFNFHADILEIRRAIHQKFGFNPRESVIRLYEHADQDFNKPLEDDHKPVNGAGLIIIRSPHPAYTIVEKTKRKEIRTEYLINTTEVFVHNVPAKKYKRY